MQRERNQGLYTADQNLNGNSATSTRQNPTSARAGLECPEERDYYPYWAPTPWRDLAIVTNTPERCEYFQMHSQNVQARGYCTAAFGVQQPISAAKCISQGGTWQTEPAFGIAPPECLVAPRAVGGLSRTAVRVPEVAQQNCALRLRYNITPAELQACSHPSYATQPACEGAGHAWSSLYLSASDNGRAAPPTSDNNPTVSLGGFLDVGGGTDSLLELAVSTNRFGRTFEDRSHAFSIVERPASVASSTLIHNLNVLGKRGNGAQTFPALTYGFTPPALAVGPDDFVHIQWTGNDNTNNNGNNNGEGTNDEDRHNIVQIGSIDSNVPLPASQASMFDVAAEVSLDPGSPSTSSRDQLALVREFALVKQNGCSANPNNDQQRTNCEKLNQAAATVDLGLLRFKPGTYTFMSTRNNNFGHRTQKGLIAVSSAPPPPLPPFGTQCESWCSTHASPMSLRCTFQACSGCADCVLPPPSPSPLSPPSLPPLQLGPGTFRNPETNQCEISCEADSRRMAEAPISMTTPSAAQHIVSSYLAAHPELTVNANLHRHMLELVKSSEHFGQPAAA